MSRGGKRAGAGRPVGTSRYGESTKTLRIPISRIEEVKDYLENQLQGIPLYSSKVRAGFPSPADDYIESYLNLNEYLIKHPASTFFLIAAGDSMTDAGIQPGDMLIVDKSLEALHGKIVIAAIDGELTVKRLSKSNGKVQLLPGNKAYKPIDITDSQDLVIWGVVTYVIHQAV
ncbi:LexA family protein [Legionella hackeliae]|uniref:SOS (Error prone) mutagenesis protein UmuD (RumA) n=1 Tax=Legionella hackeliae TaxID=449 RepID=A0A0A8UYH7_LEGHA|nr:translesion error-prone DNA polymerase V autoproteolytic subunit [Legionella hackeliae]KTD12736.1 SOS error prone mutagenesis protein UmuD (RumA) [Legionella hackeliae]CEK12157.1 SOS (Error prone) mutagenesis protein UmuD (RumA) [Legionella hackeliae]STX48944.1 SOS (error prone) mutagenesis protein UmuD (RumA) [Legionella hackeliae]